MSPVTRPLPDLDDALTGPHWRAASAGRLEVQRCDTCDELRWPPAAICPECLAVGGTWSALSGDGQVWSVATYHRAFHPGLKGDVPYRVALVELAEGPRMVTNVRDDVDAGDAVRAVFDEVAPKTALIRFELVGEERPR
jgi:uncharacterized OB-fold protein